MTTRTHLFALFCIGTATLCPAEVTISLAPTATQDELAAHKETLEGLLQIVVKINKHLATVQDETTADEAGDAICLLVKELDAQSVAYTQLPQPTPEQAEKINAWFTEHQAPMEEMLQHVERLQNEDPAFFGSSTLISAVILVGGALGGAQ